MLDPEEECDDDGDGGEHVGDLMTMRGGLGWWWRGEMGEAGVLVLVGVACEGGVGRVDICWPAGRVVVVLRPGWAAGGGGGRQRVYLWAVGLRRLRRAGGGDCEVTSGAELWLELSWCDVVVKGASDGDECECEDEKVKAKME